MSWSLKLATVRGIPIRVHISFLLIVLWAGYQGLRTPLYAGGSPVWAMAFSVLQVLLLFACVVLHELGHSLVAQVFGIRVQDITLWPIGGVARMVRLPERPSQEFLMAVAGPAVNVLLALALALVLVVWEGPRQAFARTFSFLAPWLYVPATGRLDARALFSVLLLSNVLLALFNLLPAFPMDGGRMLRAFLAAFLSRRLATQIASYAGQAVAGLMMLAGLFGPNLFLILVGFLVFLGAGAERQQVVSAESLRGLQARQAMQPIGPRLHPLQTLGETAAQVAALPQSAYLVVDGGRLTGLLGRHELLGALRKAGPQARISQFVERDVLRVRPEEQLLSVQSRMLEHRTWVAVVVEDGCVSGLLTGSAMTRLMEVVDACPAALKSAGY